MRASLSTYGGRGDVERLLSLAVRLRELGAEVQTCVPATCISGEGGVSGVL
jgi:vancomycin aglycone glucosyltransferase